MEVVAALVYLLLVAQSAVHTVWAIDAECSACEAVAFELQRRLDAEFPRTHLDMRHRLDKDGNRYGKVINYKVSEQRAVDLLDELCAEMSHYTLISDTGEASTEGSNSSSTDAAAAAGAGASDGLRSEPQSDTGGAAQQLMWVKRKGEGSTAVPASKRPSKAEEDLRVKQLTTFCGMVLERYEDEVLQALVSDQFITQGAAPVLCQRISGKCKGKQYAEHVDGASHAASGNVDKQEL